MTAFEIFLLAIITAEVLLSLQVYENLRYVRKHYRTPRNFRPSCLLIIPCKGIEDETFELNIRSFYQQEYDEYRLWFVVEDKSDPAYKALQEIKSKYAERSRARDIQILVAGQAENRSQKIHNLLFACRKASPDIEVLAFADSDALANPDWLEQLVWPLEMEHVGLASGYRWFVPVKNNSATLALSAINAKVCQFLGPTKFNLAWGGSMAIRKETFDKLEIDHIWSRSLSDDLSITQAIGKAKLQTRFVPGCMVASYEETTWAKLWEFARRQFVITRIYAPKTWWFGLIATSLSILALWAGLVLAVWALITKPEPWILYSLVAPVAFGSQLARAVFRQAMVRKALPKDRQALKKARWADLLGFWAAGILLVAVMISSAFGRTITWRGTKYRIKGPVDLEIVSQDKDQTEIISGNQVQK